MRRTRNLLRASRRNVRLSCAAGAIALWSAFVLWAAEGSVTLWVGLIAIVGVAFMARGVLTVRRLARQYGPLGDPPSDGSFAPIAYVDRPASMWRNTVPGVGGAGGDTGSDAAGS